MIRLLKRFAEWLDARFPPRVVVTQADYDALKARQEKLSFDLAAVRTEMHELARGIGAEFVKDRERVGSLEKSMAAIKELLAKGGTALVKTEADKLRDSFVRGESQRGGAPAPEVVA